MKITLLIFSFFTLFVKAQEDNDTTPFIVDHNDRTFRGGWVADNQSTGLHGGIFYADFKNLNQKFRTQYNRSLESFIYSAGISTEGIADVTRFSIFDAHGTFQYLLPMKTKFSDSLTFQLTGYHLGADLGKDLFPKVLWFDVGIYMGFNTGRFKLLRKDLSIDTKFLKYTNPFFSPKIMIEPRVVIKRLVFAIRAEYLYDISNGNWNIKDSRLPTLGTTKTTGLFIQFYAGLKINRS